MRLKGLIFLSAIIMLFVTETFVFARENKFSSEEISKIAEMSDNIVKSIDWKKTDPPTFLGILEQHSELQFITISEVPKGWIKEEHIKKLIKLVDSAKPAVPVVSIFSSYLPIGEKSTVGNEAMFLIEGFRKDRYPPELCSVHYFKGDPEEFKQWYRVNFMADKAKAK